MHDRDTLILARGCGEKKGDLKGKKCYNVLSNEKGRIFKAIGNKLSLLAAVSPPSVGQVTFVLFGLVVTCYNNKFEHKEKRRMQNENDARSKRGEIPKKKRRRVQEKNVACEEFHFRVVDGPFSESTAVEG